MQFLESQRQEAFGSAMSLATQMDAGSCRELPKKAASFREAVTTLSGLDLKVEQALKAECAEEQWPFRMFTRVKIQGGSPNGVALNNA